MNCRLCQHAMTAIMDFGHVALAGGFLRPKDFETEKTYPLELMFCEHCYSVQIKEAVEPCVMFENYFYFTSATRTGGEHFSQCADDIVDRFNPSKVVEIGCNDGALLKRLADRGVRYLVGVDPAANVTKTIDDKRIDIHNVYFESGYIGFGADVIVANNVFAHVADLNSFTEGVKRALTDHGVFVFEVHDLGAMICDLQYDWIYHEHVYYHSMPTLQKHFARHGMTIFDVKEIPLHGGSRRYYVCKDVRPVSKNVAIDALDALVLTRLELFQDFARFVAEHRRFLTDKLNGIRAKGKTIIGYGASGRANAMIQYCGLDLPLMVDDAPAKHDYYTPGSHIPIVSNNILKTRPPDYVLLFAWTYAEEILPKVDCNVIVPLPTVRVIENKAAA